MLILYLEIGPYPLKAMLSIVSTHMRYLQYILKMQTGFKEHKKRYGSKQNVYHI